MNWYLAVLKKYTVFSGRASRKEYWMFFLIHILILMGLKFLGNMGGRATIDMMSMLSGIYSLAVALPGIAVGVRRLHDIDKSGWWLLIGLVPLAGAIVLLIFMVTEGDSGKNQYGAKPKAKPEV